MKELKQSEGGLLRYRAHGKLVVEGRAEAVDAANRRGQFRLLIADPYLAALKKKKMEDSPDTGNRARLLSEIS
jgi:hypothetical protein